MKEGLAMEWSWIWKSVLIVLGGTLLLRIAGRKSISQMTLAQTVIMIGIGSLLIQPLAGENVWTTLGVGILLVITLIIMEFVQVKSDKIETLITGKAKVLIENGRLNEKNLKKYRLTVDQLEMNFRQNNIARMSDVEWATLEPNGQIGYSLKQDAQPATSKQLRELKEELQQLKDLLLVSQAGNQKSTTDQGSNLFTEVARTSHGENEPLKHLQ
jgi:uncharacterized membrane protein YcaP (DUF421 family)